MPYPQPVINIDDLPKSYEGLLRERFWQQYWRECGVYNFSATRPDGTVRKREEIFSVDTPPPTVSGALHIGHVFSYTQTDFSVRYQRMRGRHVFYPFGFDDNGLPSERLVERITGKRAHEVGREAFIEMCRPILADAEQQFKDLWESLALSCDWSQFYTTIDARSRAISQASFIDLYNKGYVYRKVAPTQWDWVNQTAIAQAEIEDKEVAGKFHDIVFKWADGPGQPVRGELIIATTRPELIPACVAVFAHPDDERYKHLFGKVAITPLFEVEVPILPSEKADPEKGSGILMCCTFGDMEDVEHWEQFNLPNRVIIEKNGKIGDFSERFGEALVTADRVDQDCLIRGERYDPDKQKYLSVVWPSRKWEKASELARSTATLKTDDSQQWIREQLQSAGLLRGVRDIMHIVRHSERGGKGMEILLTPQWYIRILDFKQELMEQGRKVRWHPEWMYKRYEHWVEGLNQDWCISRQRFNGVPFPVWYGLDGKPVVATLDSLPVDPLTSRPGQVEVVALAERISKALNLPVDASTYDPQKVFTPEPDVMDTWATSSVTPLLNTHLIIGLKPDSVAAAASRRSESMEDGGKLPLPLNPPPLELPPPLNLPPPLELPPPLLDVAETLQRHNQLFPYDLRPQAHDIIRTWAFYTITKALYHFGSEQGADGKWHLITDEQKLRQALPWRDIVISGHAQDAGHKKISKSKGHVVTPAQMVEKYTADGLRYWSSGCKLGTDTLYDEKLLGDGRRLITKLFNATKFALRHLLEFDPVALVGQASLVGRTCCPSSSAEDTDKMSVLPDTDRMSVPPERNSVPPEEALLPLVVYPTDRWILARLSETVARATKAQEEYEFGDAKQLAEDFFWADFCDNYLELSKGRLYGEPLALDAHGPASAHPYTPEELKASAQAALFICLSAVLKLFAPLLPHICEECWSWYFAQWSGLRSIHEESWPDSAALPADEAAQAAGSALVDTLALVRKFKSQANVSVKKPVTRILAYRTEQWKDDAYSAQLASVMGDLLATANAAAFELADGAAPEFAASLERSPLAVVCEMADEA